MYAFYENDEKYFGRCTGKLILPLPKWNQERKQELWEKIKEGTLKGNLGLSVEAMCDENNNQKIDKNENSIEIDTHHFYDLEELIRIIYHLHEINAIPIKIHGMNMSKGHFDFVITNNEIQSFENFKEHFIAKYGSYFRKKNKRRATK